tara:strand:+ start:138 stop:764 length:627 start_codon:yes stop_codon:yes gene_type:complete
MLLKRRNFLLGVGVFFLFSKKSLSNQNSLKVLMRKKLLGSENAPIKIKEFFSLTCGHCANFHLKTLPQLKKKYIDAGKVQLEFIDYPLDRLAVIAATLARSIPTKDGYVEAVSILLKKQKQWAYSKKPLDELQSIAKLFGISSKKFNEISQNIPLMQEIVKKMENESKNFDINSTPTFIVNDEYKISGALSFKDFEKEILKSINAKKS